MPKRLDITPKIKAALIKATDGAVDGSTVAVFETISLNTKPLSKRGLFDKGVVTPNTLQQMANYVNGGGNVPLHTMHDQGSELPVGKTFMGEIFEDTNGMPELRSLFYVPLDKTDLISDLENDVISEVSVGMQTLHINCSTCGWDYMSDEATFSNLYNGVCANDHEIGVDGVHVMLNGLARWYEQSLVSLGAANGAKIQARTKSLMGAENYDKLAASGHNPEITVLYATSPLKKANKMDIEKLNAQLIESGTNLGITKSELTSVNATLATTKTALDAAQAALVTKDKEIATLTAAATAFAATDATKLKLELTAAQEAAETARKTLLAETTRMAVALGLDKPKDDAAIETLVAELATNRTKMEATFGSKPGLLLTTSTAQPNAFKGA